MPLPTEKNVCVIRSPFKDKDSREHFEIRTRKRLIDVSRPEAVGSLLRLDLPATSTSDQALGMLEPRQPRSA